MTEIERGMRYRMENKLPQFNDSKDWWAGWAMYDEWLQGYPWEFLA